MQLCLVAALLIHPSIMNVFLALCTLIYLGTVLHFLGAQSNLLAQALRARFEKASAGRSIGCENGCHRLDISRLDAGVIAAQRQPIALQELFQTLNRNFMDAASEKELELRVRTTSLWAESDPQLLGRLLSKLADNAIKYTQSCGILVLAHWREGEVWGKYTTPVSASPLNSNP